MLPSLGADEKIDGDRVGHGVVYAFQSFTQPPIAFVADARTGEAQQVVRLAMPRGLDIDNIAVEQTTYPSRDGTPVTMFLVRRTDVRPTGAVPTLLTGYGGGRQFWAPPVLPRRRASGGGGGGPLPPLPRP